MSDSPAGQDASQPVWTDPVAELRGAVDHGVRRRAGRPQRARTAKPCRVSKSHKREHSGSLRTEKRGQNIGPLMGGRDACTNPRCACRSGSCWVGATAAASGLRGRPRAGTARNEAVRSIAWARPARGWGVVKSRATPRVAKGKCSKEKRPHTHVHTHTGIVGSHAAPVPLFLCAAPQRYVPSAEQARL